MPATLSIHRYTPSLTASDPRGLPVRAVGYWRDIDGVPAQTRVNRTAHDWAGRAIAQWDPRLFPDASAPANLQTVYALSGVVLSTSSVDAGGRVALLGEAGQPLHHWDGRGSQRWMRYDTRLRPESVFEQAMDGEALCAERLSYAAKDQAFANHNQCGQLIRHDDPAGTQLFEEFGLAGALLEQIRHFLREPDSPDWPELVADRNALLEPGAGASTRLRCSATGEAIEQTDAQGNRQFFRQTISGQLREVCLQLKNDTALTTLVSAIQYSAQGQTEREIAGNGVITLLDYDPQNARLVQLQARRGNDVLQDLSYEYDPTGNVTSIEDAAVPIRFFANQRIEPIGLYVYDSLYQLISATGWEAGGPNKGPQFSAFDDPAPRGNYRQTYHYDRGGNLLELVHEGPQCHSHRLVAAASGNRCLPVVDGVEPGEEDFRKGFDANGNLLILQPGQTLDWDVRNQLREVRPVEHASGVADSERYIYGADGMRVRKVRAMQTNARTVMAEVRYLPNLEIRTHSGTGEALQVISVQAGRSSVRVLHWESPPPNDSANDQYRYSLSDHLGSCILEFGSDGEVISQERYHPFGTTAWFAGRGEVEASRKTVRYSGKERDSTGLYYYGFRYYVPWLQRWLNPDPAGIRDGLNIFAFVSGNPLSFKDVQGLDGIDISNPTPRQSQIVGLDGPQISPAQAMYVRNISWPGNTQTSPPIATTHRVSQTIWGNLDLADRANRFSKALLPYGSDNIVVDIWRTRGESVEKVGLARPGGIPSLPDALAVGAGNCAEFARLSFNLLASTARTEPVFRVDAESAEHAFVVIGDSRSLSEVIVVDPWPTFPHAHLAAHGRFSIGVVRESIGPGPADPRYNVDNLHLERNSQITFSLKFGDKERKGLIKKINQRIYTSQQWFSLSDQRVVTDYAAQSPGDFSTLPQSYVEDRLGSYLQYLDERKKK